MAETFPGCSSQSQQKNMKDHNSNTVHRSSITSRTAGNATFVFSSVHAHPPQPRGKSPKRKARPVNLNSQAAQKQRVTRRATGRSDPVQLETPASEEGRRIDLQSFSDNVLLQTPAVVIFDIRCAAAKATVPARAWGFPIRLFSWKLSQMPFRLSVVVDEVPPSTTTTLHGGTESTESAGPTYAFAPFSPLPEPFLGRWPNP